MVMVFRYFLSKGAVSDSWSLGYKAVSNHRLLLEQTLGQDTVHHGSSVSSSVKGFQDDDEQLAR